MITTKYLSPGKITKQFDISSGTLRKWALDGKIKFLRPNDSRRIYNAEDVAKIIGAESEHSKKKVVLYARVSSAHQKEDLERQIQVLQQAYPDAEETIKDVGSGLNWNRRGFSSLLEQVHRGDVQTVVVTYKDRLCRFAFELVEWIFKKAAVKLVVLHDDGDSKEDPTKELAEDLLAITTVFVARHNGLRAREYKKDRDRKESKERTNETGKTSKDN